MRCHGPMFAAVALFQADDGMRDFLEGVYVESHPQGGAYMVATDGVQLCVARDPIGEVDYPAIYRTDPALLKAAQSPGMAVVGDHRELRVVHVETEVYERIRLADPQIEDPDRFPEWRQSVRGLFTSQYTAPGHLSAFAVARLAKAAKLVGGKGALACMQTVPVGPGHITYFGAREDFFVVSMSLRGEPERTAQDVLGWIHGEERGLFRSRPDDVDEDGVVSKGRRTSKAEARAS